jgi:phosphoglycerate dehydrogenase-like enzyme
MAKPVALVHLPGLTADLVRELSGDNLAVDLIAAEDEGQVAQRIGSAGIMIATPLPKEVMSGGANLKWIQSLSAGVESWLQAELPATLPITRMVGVYEKYMAEWVFAHLLSDTQKLSDLARAQSRREWLPLNTSSLAGLTLGIAGLGHIGSAVARLGKAFGMRVWGLRRNPATLPENVADRSFDRAGLYEFLGGLDVLVLVLPATAETDRMFGLREFTALPPGATFMNMGRGQPVDEDALLQVLRDGHLRRAVIDTFRTEPLPKESPLWNAPNLTMTPHMAGAVYPSELADVVARNVRTFLSGTIPPPTVERERGY